MFLSPSGNAPKSGIMEKKGKRVLTKMKDTMNAYRGKGKRLVNIGYLSAITSKEVVAV